MTSAEFRAILDQLHLTQGAIARLLGYHRRSMEKWAGGDRQIPPPVAILLRLLAAGRITADDIERARD
jgi:DNA-binding transcriptional regulator YiaG